ncbi:Lar family restriction alleviation protein [Shinella sp. CPCC 101442]|uniref:Lar family restriction alleviation protein n=1 Tax=Shinella sp. CPCC 101442 TaxID=2932265 RepID=UPI0021538EA8|nr:Lar family restriction alleviation protein [Shinella sp. CPCC 101442]MCR6502540.1 Lar family restriction alleviation protein [Shinella sp. CPCC 101442]
MKIELKPCPFCGGTNICPSSWDIQCYDCKATVPGEFHLSAPFWNRRAALAEQTQQGVDEAAIMKAYNAGFEASSSGFNFEYCEDYEQSNEFTAERAGTVREIAAALVDVPAVESEPVAWQPKYKQDVIDHHRIIGDGLWEYAMTVYPTKAQAEGYGYGGHEARPLYAHPPRSLSNEGRETINLTVKEAENLAARLEFEALWDKCDGYHSIKNQLLALSTRKGSAGDGSATGTTGGDHG